MYYNNCIIILYIIRTGAGFCGGGKLTSVGSPLSPGGSVTISSVPDATMVVPAAVVVTSTAAAADRSTPVANVCSTNNSRAAAVRARDADDGTDDMLLRRA